MKKVGLVGGIGPASTLDYYKGIIDSYRVRTSGDNYPEMIIEPKCIPMYQTSNGMSLLIDWSTQ